MEITKEDEKLTETDFLKLISVHLKDNAIGYFSNLDEIYKNHLKKWIAFHNGHIVIEEEQSSFEDMTRKCTEKGFPHAYISYVGFREVFEDKIE